MFIWKHLKNGFICKYTCMLIVILILATRGEWTTNCTMIVPENLIIVTFVITEGNNIHYTFCAIETEMCSNGFGES